MKISVANARSPSLSFGDYARNNLRKYPCSHRTQRETARFGMKISVANTRSPSLSFRDYARKYPCSHRTQRETARLGIKISVTNARSTPLAYYARNYLNTTARFFLLKTNLKHRRPVFAGNKKTFLLGLIGNPIQHL